MHSPVNFRHARLLNFLFSLMHRFYHRQGEELVEFASVEQPCPMNMPWAHEPPR